MNIVDVKTGNAGHIVDLVLIVASGAIQPIQVFQWMVIRIHAKRKRIVRNAGDALEHVLFSKVPLPEFCYYHTTTTFLNIFEYFEIH